MSHPLGQRVQAEEHKTKSQDGKHQNDGHDDHKDIGLTGRGDERRQMMRRGRVKWLSHTETLAPRPTSPPPICARPKRAALDSSTYSVGKRRGLSSPYPG
jgi:hypothetical protein